MNSVYFSKPQIVVSANRQPIEPPTALGLEQFLSDSAASMDKVRDGCKTMIEGLPDHIGSEKFNQILEIAGNFLAEHQLEFAKEIVLQLLESDKLTISQSSTAANYLGALSDSKHTEMLTPISSSAISDSLALTPRQFPSLKQLSQHFAEFAEICRDPNSKENLISLKQKQFMSKLEKSTSEKDATAPEIFLALLELGIEMENEGKKKRAQEIFSILKNAIEFVPYELKTEVKFRSVPFRKGPNIYYYQHFSGFAKTTNRPMAAYQYWKMTENEEWRSCQQQGINNENLWALKKAAEEGCKAACEEYAMISNPNKGIARNRSRSEGMTNNKDVTQNLAHRDRVFPRPDQLVPIIIQEVADRRRYAFPHRSNRGVTLGADQQYEVKTSVLERSKSEGVANSNHRPTQHTSPRLGKALPHVPKDGLKKSTDHPLVRERSKSEGAEDNKRSVQLVFHRPGISTKPNSIELIATPQLKDRPAKALPNVPERGDKYSTDPHWRLEVQVPERSRSEGAVNNNAPVRRELPKIPAKPLSPRVEDSEKK